MFALLPLVLPIAGGILLFIVKSLHKERARNIFTAVIMILTFAAAAYESLFAKQTLILWKITENVSFTIGTDRLGTYFAFLMNFMFTVVGFYSMDYMKHDRNNVRFFGFFLIVMGVLNGVYQSQNLITMYLFYELMTLLSFPLVIHELTKEAISAGFKYLYYSIAGAFLSLISIFLIYSYADTFDFIPGGFLDSSKVNGNRGLLLAFVFLAIIGFGCKAGLFPLHDWLPAAHPVAPAPASAILSGIVTKTGVIAIIRLVYYSVGVENLKGTWVQYAWMIVSLFTVFMGSMMAYREKVFKRRLAFSTVSQVSYVLFGLSLMNEVGFMGALLHVVFHSVIKDDLFLVSGSVIHNTGHKNVDELTGIGKRMPVTIMCFTVSSIALIGIPPASGFVSKWFLATGALTDDIGVLSYIGPAVLLISALLTAGYLLPLTVNGYFPGKDFEGETAKCEASKLSLIPIIILAVLALLLGIFPGILENCISSISSQLWL